MNKKLLAEVPLLGKFSQIFLREGKRNLCLVMVFDILFVRYNFVMIFMDMFEH